MTSTDGNLHVTAEPGRHDIVITREFDAHRDLVFDTFTDPEAVPLWWGQTGSNTVVDVMDVRPGGRWRYVEKSDDGAEYAFNGVYHQVKPHERLVYTFEFEGMPGHVLLETIDFVDLGDGRTRLVDTSVFQAIEDRDGMLQSGMESGARESMDQLAALLAERLAS
ncbi:MAG: ATPase [Streptosporangiales bacterium]|nr:ATPase [Streptosporangiales bacterium]